MNLSIGLTWHRSLITEVDLQLSTFLPTLRRLDPELVVPSRCITFSISNSTTNDKCVIAVCFLDDFSWEWVRTFLTIVVHIHVCTLLLAPCANLEVILQIVEFHISKSEFSPRFLGITISKLFFPLYRTLFLAFVGNLQVCDVKATNIVATLHEQVAIGFCTFIIKSTFNPLGSDRELSIRSLTKAKQ